MDCLECGLEGTKVIPYGGPAEIGCDVVSENLVEQRPLLSVHRNGIEVHHVDDLGDVSHCLSLHRHGQTAVRPVEVTWSEHRFVEVETVVHHSRQKFLYEHPDLQPRDVQSQAMVQT